MTGAPGGIRTLDPRIRSPLLYPAELQALNLATHCIQSHSKKAVYKPFAAFCQEPNAHFFPLPGSTDESGYPIEAIPFFGDPFTRLVRRIKMAARRRIEPAVELSCA